MLPGNMECADCGAHCPDWASVNHGALGRNKGFGVWGLGFRV